MKKEVRLERIQQMLNHAGTVTVGQIMQELSVSDMTVRRDLSELAEQGILIRTHGGARRIYNDNSGLERSHLEKKSLHETEKSMIAAAAVSQIHDGETIFIGAGTTLEQLASQLKNRTLRVVTISLPVFEILNRVSTIDLLLLGGQYRSITGAFVGTIPLQAIRNMRFSKAFISINGLVGDEVYTYSEEEGAVQKAALDSSSVKYLAADSSKFNQYDFFPFYKVSDFDHIITDDKISEQMLEELRTKTDVIVAKQN